jgi:hypothetical protein
LTRSYRNSKWLTNGDMNSLSVNCISIAWFFFIHTNYFLFTGKEDMN